MKSRTTDPAGFIDAIENGYIRGWAWSARSPDQSLEISLGIDDIYVSTSIADLFRQDVKDAGYGTGWYGFQIKIPDDFLDSKSHNIRIALDENSGREIARRDAVTLVSSDEAVIRARAELMFDTVFYNSQLGTTLADFNHYKNVGWKRGINPHPLFDTNFYISRRERNLTADPLTDFVQNSTPERIENTHPLIDGEAYGRRRPDVIKAGQQPILHYAQRGLIEREVASIFFDDNDYDRRCEGVRDFGFLPLIHYISHWREGHRPHVEFDPSAFHRLAQLEEHVEPYGYFVTTLLDTKHKANHHPINVPVVSVVILNLNKTLTTLQCLYFLRAFTEESIMQIIVVDNGSNADQYKMLREFSGDATVVRSDENRGFGEGCNIGAERAQGKYIMFLNNDAFVTKGWLKPLLEEMETFPTTGAAGCKLIYADGALQEAGATITSCGTALQRGKHLRSTEEFFNTRKEVDYCSAAALLMRTGIFNQVLGFDLCWDPAYYEDADICLKLKLIGKKVVYIPESTVVHLEHATSSDGSLRLGLHNIVSVNRQKFISRWGSYIENKDSSAVEYLIPKQQPSQNDSDLGCNRPIFAAYTPYPLYPGGGERYLLSTLVAMRSSHRCILFIRGIYSRLRIDTLGRELDLALDHVELYSISDIRNFHLIDVYFSMSNHTFPETPPYGHLNIYHSQFPFPTTPHHYAQSSKNLDGYDVVIVNSEFTKAHYEKAARLDNLDFPHVAVISPPVPIRSEVQNKFNSDKFRILNVGRFTSGGHCKRQDTIIEQFRHLRSFTDIDLELHLVGALPGDSDSRDYFSTLQQRAVGQPVYFHLNVSPNAVFEQYSRADFYWHATGAGLNLDLQPESFEHFGITIVEAMSMGVIPICLKHGGPAEIVENGESGILIDDAQHLAQATLRLMGLSREALEMISLRARKRADCFSFSRFKDNLIYQISVVKKQNSRSFD